MDEVAVARPARRAARRRVLAGAAHARPARAPRPRPRDRGRDGHGRHPRARQRRLARALARRAGGAIVSTSANLSGEAPPVRPEALAATLRARLDHVLDGGATPGGLPSTVVAVDTGALRLLRQGAVPVRGASSPSCAGRPADLASTPPMAEIVPFRADPLRRHPRPRARTAARAAVRHGLPRAARRAAAPQPREHHPPHARRGPARRRPDVEQVPARQRVLGELARARRPAARPAPARSTRSSRPSSRPTAGTCGGAASWRRCACTSSTRGSSSRTRRRSSPRRRTGSSSSRR